MKIVFIGGTKGGTGKTTLSHFVALGAALAGHESAYVLTDPARHVRESGRPYPVLDGRNPQALAPIVQNAREAGEGLLVIDGGGNRPAFDQELARIAHITLLPYRASEEDLDTVAADLVTMPDAVAWPMAWTTNVFARKAAQPYVEALQQAFAGRVISTPIPFVNSSAELLSTSLENASTMTRNVARATYFELLDRLEKLENLNKTAQVKG
jgi:chromosome partitioning protein